MQVVLPLALALLAAPATAVAGAFRPNWAAPVGAVAAALAFMATLWGWASGGGVVELAWAPSMNLAATFALDGLAALYALLATGIGFGVVLYAGGYLPLHLEHQHRPSAEQAAFFPLLLLFMGAMVGLVMALDLLALFVFWDVTAITSYYLIAYDRRSAEARSSALMALLVTGGTSVLFLVGAVMLFATHGTFSIPSLAARVEPGPALGLAVALISVAALAKSAQVPFQFWLPHAMAAPTPVSAYLHSAAMVAAGVFVLERLFPLLRAGEPILDVLLCIGLLSMMIGSVLALTRDILKQLLAYSTIAQYGYVVTMLGLGGEAGVAGASYYVLAHALVKSALFMTAGAVVLSTGEHTLRLGGLGSRMPLLAAASGAAAAGLAGLPLTTGFFKDELFFRAALERGWVFAALATLGAGLTLAYMWRFWAGLFLGPESGEVRPIPPALTAPVVALGLATVFGGVVAGPFASLAESAGTTAFGAPTPVDLGYHLDLRTENLLALATYVLGSLIVLTRSRWEGLANRIARLGEIAGPEQWYEAGMGGLSRLATLLHDEEVRDLRRRVETILIPTALLVGAGWLADPARSSLTVEAIRPADFPLLLALLVVALASLLTARSRDQLTLVLVVSGVGYALGAAYAFMGAPDVALVAVLVETIFTLLLLGMLALLPMDVLRRLEAASPRAWGGRWRDALIGISAAALAFLVAWAALTQSAPETVATAQIELAPSAHARDVVTAVLADFRGLDTMGEITVIVVSLLGVVTLLRGGELWRR